MNGNSTQQQQSIKFSTKVSKKKNQPESISLQIPSYFWFKLKEKLNDDNNITFIY